MPIRKYFIDFIKFAIITALECGICVFILNYINITSLILQLIIGIIISISIFCIVTIILFRKNEGYIFIKDTVKNYVGKFKNRFLKIKS